MNDNERNYDEVSGQSDALTRMLRDGDPVTDDPGMPAIEISRLRQEITETARNHSLWHPLIVRLPWMNPALSIVTTGIVIAGLWFFFGPSPTPPDPVAAAGSSIPPASEPVVPEPMIADATPSRRRSAGFTTIQPAPKLPSRAIPEFDGVGDTTINDLSVPDVQPRTVRFTTRHGTRIIWTLDPDFESPIPGPRARQEQGK